MHGMKTRLLLMAAVALVVTFVGLAPGHKALAVTPTPSPTPTPVNTIFSFTNFGADANGIDITVDKAITAVSVTANPCGGTTSVNAKIVNTNDAATNRDVIKVRWIVTATNQSAKCVGSNEKVGVTVTSDATRSVVDSVWKRCDGGIVVAGQGGGAGEGGAASDCTLSVGGIAELPDADLAASLAAGSSGSSPPPAGIAALAAAGVVSVGAAGWYARRRRSPR